MQVPPAQHMHHLTPPKYPRKKYTFGVSKNALPDEPHLRNSRNVRQLLKVDNSSFGEASSQGSSSSRCDGPAASKKKRGRKAAPHKHARAQPEKPRARPPQLNVEVASLSKTEVQSGYSSASSRKTAYTNQTRFSKALCTLPPKVSELPQYVW